MTETNPLERALQSAADDPASRPDFYRLLLDSVVFVIGGAAEGRSGNRTLSAGEKINIQNWERSDGTPVIPFFTSLSALQQAVEEPAGYLGLPARSLFEATKGSTLVLNPKLEYGREFHPREIEALLAEGVPGLGEQRVSRKETKVLLGQPQVYPSRMVDALTMFLAKRSQVKAAYLLLMHDPSKDEKPHLVVGLDAEGDVEFLFREIGTVAADTSPNGDPVDFCRVAPGDRGLSEYFLESVEPFYQRSWGGRLKGMLGIGHA